MYVYFDRQVCMFTLVVMCVCLLWSSGVFGCRGCLVYNVCLVCMFTWLVRCVCLPGRSDVHVYIGDQVCVFT